MVRLSDVRIDPIASREGVWTTIWPGEPPWEMRIARSTLRFARELQRIDADLTRKIDEETATLDEERSYCEQVAPIVVEHCIRDWRGLVGDDGEEIPFDPEGAIAILSDPSLTHVLRRVIIASVDMTLFRAQEVADEGKG